MYIVTKKIEEVFNVLGKLESESDEKEKKFWTEIDEAKIHLVDIINDSK